MFFFCFFLVFLRMARLNYSRFIKLCKIKLRLGKCMLLQSLNTVLNKNKVLVVNNRHFLPSKYRQHAKKVQNFKNNPN